MESLRDWVLLLSGTALLSAVCGALIPPGARGAFRVLCTLAVLYAVLLPLRGVSADTFDFDGWPEPQTQVQEALEARTQDAALLAAQTTLQKEIETALRRAGQTALSVGVRCARFDDGIAPARIILRGKGDKAAVAAVLAPYLTARTKWSLTEEKHDD